MSAETMKMPDPIIEPTTSEIAASGPMPRMNSDGGEVAGGVWTEAAMSPRLYGCGGGITTTGSAGGFGAGPVGRLSRGGRRLGNRRRGAGPGGALGRSHRLVHNRLAGRREPPHHLGGTVHQSHGAADRLDRQLARAHGVLDRLGDPREDAAGTGALRILALQKLDV